MVHTPKFNIDQEAIRIGLHLITYFVTILIKHKLPDAQIDIKDMGGGDHLEVNVISAKFSGLSLVQQHQLIYSALENELKTETIHALALKTSIPL